MSGLALPASAAQPVTQPAPAGPVEPSSLGAGPAPEPGSDGAATTSVRSERGTLSGTPPVSTLTPSPAGDTDRPSEYVPGESVLVARGVDFETYRNPNGTHTMRYLPQPTHVEVAPGRFEPADLTLEAATAADVPAAGRSGEALTAGKKPKRHALNPVFSADGTGGTFAVQADGVSLRVMPAQPGARRSAGEAGGKVRFPAAAEADDVDYELTAGSVKETIVVADRLAAGDGSWASWVDVVGGSLALDGTGGVSVRDSAGREVMRMPRPYVTDSAGVAGQREPADVNGVYSLTEQGGRYLLTVTVPAAWLDDPARVWPVLVDPTVTKRFYDNIRSYKTNGTVVEGGNVRMGSPNDGGNLWRSVIRYPYGDLVAAPTQLADATELAAAVEARFAWAGVGTSTAQPMSFHHATDLTYGGVGQELASDWLGGDGELTQLFDQRLDDFMFGAFDRREDYYWFMARGNEQPSAYTYKTAYSELWLNINWTADAATLQAPAAGAGGQKVEPVLTAAATDRDGDQVHYRYVVSRNSDPDSSPVWDSGYVTNASVTVPRGRLLGGTTHSWKVYTADLCNLPTEPNPCGKLRRFQSASEVRTFTTQRPPNPVDNLAARPVAGTIATLTPTLTVPAVTDPDGSAVGYEFSVASGGDGVTGTVISSGRLSSPTWTVPPGFLRDGKTYTWTAWSHDGTDRDQRAWSNRLTVDLRTGDPKTSPVDAAGPVTVNLANGNAIVRAESPTAQFAKNNVGFAFTYNTQASVAERGLTATYYSDANRDGTIDEQEQTRPLMERLEPVVNQDWGLGSPQPGLVPEDHFGVIWKGFVTVPTSGTYTFGSRHDDNIKVDVKGITAVQGTCCLSQPTAGTQPIELTARVPVPVTVHYTEAFAPAFASLYVKGPATGEALALLPGEWLSPEQTPALPAGWTLSTDVDGTSPYVRAVVSELSITLRDASGAAHTWAKTDTGTWTPPTGEAGVLTVSTATDGTAGQITLLEDDGARSVFSSDGRLLSYVPSDITGNPHPLSYEWVGTRLSRVVDGMSGQAVRLTYGNGTGTVTRPSCDTTTRQTEVPPANSVLEVPRGKLCRISYPDGSESRLWYSAATDGRLMQITDPGAEHTQFGYDSTGRLASVRDPLAYDAVTAGQAANDATSATVLSYDAGAPAGPGPRVTKVTSPAPKDAAGTVLAGPERSYAYTTSFGPGVTGATEVRIAGLTPAPPSGWARKVTFNDRLQAVTDTDAAGATSSTSYRPDDLLEKTTDPAGRVSTTVYDAADRPSVQYGPAPASCFSGLQGTLCGQDVPRTQTGYDEGMNFLHVAWFNNAHMTGAPVAQTMGLPRAAATTPLWADWAGDSPTSGVNADGFTARATGNLTLPAAGNYSFMLNSDDGARLWVNNVLAVDQWEGKTSQTVRGPLVPNLRGAGAVVPIRLELREGYGAANVQVRWTQPGQREQAIPASVLAPAYNLVTSSTEADASAGGATTAQTTRTSYGARPWEGLAESTTVDPGGLGLTTQVRYDPDRRRAARALPGGNVDDPAARYTDTYYGNTEPRDNPCTADVETTNQAGRLATNTAPASADGNQIVREQVYDRAGQVAASRTNLSEPWTCTSYDTRGRELDVRHPAYGSQPARTVTTNHAVGGNPLVSSVTDPAGAITTRVDVLGRVIEYTDIEGVTTTTAYDQAGRATTSTTRRTAGGAQISVQQFDYDSGGRLARQSLNGRVLAAPAYNSAGETTSVAYPAGTGNGGNATSGTLERDSTGRLKTLSWTLPGGTVTNQVTRSQAGNVLTDTLSSTLPGVSVPGPAAYRYDAAGRLTSADIHRHRLSYAFDPSGGCGANPSAGRNTNRTRLVDTPLDAAGTAGTPVTTSYCYDKADRLTAVTGGGTSAGGPDLTGNQLSYDSHGNTTTLGTQSLGYDNANRHLSITVTGTEAGTVTYKRDATDRIVQRASTIASDNSIQRYAYLGDGDTGDLTLDNLGNPIEQHLSLPGGVLYTHRITDNTRHTWSYPNIHGDVTASAAQTGAIQGPLRAYDPYGQAIDLNTGAIGQTGTPAANDQVPDNSAGDFDYGWLGQHQRPYEHAGSLASVQMGARLLHLASGRFASTDPIQGGGANDYMYLGDPLNALDLDGMRAFRRSDCLRNHGFYSIRLGGAGTPIGCDYTRFTRTKKGSLGLSRAARSCVYAGGGGILIDVATRNVRGKRIWKKVWRVGWRGCLGGAIGSLRGR